MGKTRHLLRGVLAALTITAVAAGSAGPASAAVIEPDSDPFYAPPSGFETAAPGTILRSRSITVTGLGIPIPVTSNQLLVRSTDSRGGPIAVATTVMVPLTPYIGTRPLLSYQPAIDSLGDQCNPSYTLRTGLEKELPLMALGLAQGWAVVVTDYQGPLDAYGAGTLEGRAVLDGVRAAERLGGTGLGSSTPVGLWGYSGGGIATGWAAQLAPSYAPELNLVGVASGGTPADVEATGRQMDGGLFSGLFLAASVGVSREYPELLGVFNEAGMQLVDEIGDKCVTDEAAGYALRRLSDYSDSPDPLSEPLVLGVLDQLKMGGLTPTAPVYMYHSLFDELAPYSGAAELRQTWCAAGVTVLFSTDVLSEHNSLAVTGAPGAVAYLASRFAGIAPLDNCP